MSELPVIVGAKRSNAAGRLIGDKGDQLVYGDDGGLVVYSATAIDGVLVSQHRPCLLVVDGVRFVIRTYTLEGRQHVYRCEPWQPGPYEREGAVVDYDPDRVHHHRVERLHLFVRALVLLVLLPAVPVLGLLPEDTKKQLKEHGLLPGGSQMSSLVFEWMLLLLVVAAELLLVVSGSLVGAGLCALVALTLLVDIPHRVVLAAENRDIGVFAWPRELWRSMRAEPPAPDQPKLEPPQSNAGPEA